MLKKIISYRIIILSSVCLLIKYTLIRIFLSDKKLINYLSAQNRSTKHKYFSRKSHSLQELTKMINRVFHLVYPNGNCLISSLIKRDILYKHGYIEPIFLGLKNTDQGLKAHAWLSNENAINYKIVHLLP